VPLSELKTSRNDRSVEEFLGRIEDEQKRRDSFQILDLMKKATQASPEMWGGSIVGFGSYRYRYESGREREWFLTGFSPRKRKLTL
jgi:hypothetical protein